MSAQLAQALELGLDAAKTVLTERKASFAGYPHKWRHEQETCDTIAEAIVALAAHEAAPQQEPVAEVYRAHHGGRSRNIGFDDVRPLRGATLPPPGTMLYAAPQQAQAPDVRRPFDAVKSFADGVLSMLDERIKAATQATHPFNEKFGDPETFVAANAQASELKEVRWQVRALGDLALVEIMRANRPTAPQQGSKT